MLYQQAGEEPGQFEDGAFSEIILDMRAAEHCAEQTLLDWLPKLAPDGAFSGNHYAHSSIRAGVDAFFGSRQSKVIQFGSECWRASLAPLGPHTYQRDYNIDRDDETGKMVIHLNFIPWGGLGDMLMASAAMGALWDRYPDLLFDCYCTRFGEVFRYLPFVRNVVYFKAPKGSAHMQTFGDPADGVRGVIASVHYALGTSDIPPAERHMRYLISEEEHSSGKDILESCGWAGEPLLGLQVHGGWRTKRWKRAADFARMATAEGYRVVLFGQNYDAHLLGDGSLPMAGEEDEASALIRECRVINFCGRLSDVRALAGAQAHLSAWAGFDSGGSFLASTLGIPTVAMYASHDPSMLIGSSGANGPVETVWPNRAWSCQQTHGTNCRTDIYPAYYGSSGDFCPLMHGADGAVCLNEIEPEQVMALVKKIARPPRVVETVGPFLATPESTSIL